MTKEDLAKNMASYEPVAQKQFLTDTWLQNDMWVAHKTALKNIEKSIPTKGNKEKNLEAYKKYYKEALLEIWTSMPPDNAKQHFIMETFESEDY